ncbi:hypothetical protein GCM10010112_70830 [Actinoplanes lobatus]|uniref:Uncharacterized protein n=1 Tax=Actinoplanes lobatus TaxID=113568 RepID=A0A7W7HLY7_9ACTN|nr:DUF6086 family protein [Actinoplanes lobatus]MBB4752939.1 hypothetical protein [Actinoplanes lobatus]GGN87837.1 hypothetical protein GCM10010112_70830 [Actinoplanes lobatus]GIE39546.1 hypothetical protein Alo02nite_24440 [Actinoplanes lobatus]
MSQFFKVDDLTLWNPSNRVAQLFYRSCAAVAPVVGLPPGVVDNCRDEYEVDLDVFVPFVDALVREYRASSHAVLRSLLEGLLPAAMVLVQRAGGELPSLSGQVGTSRRDVSVGVGGIAPSGDGERLVALARELAGAMPV